MGTMAGGLSLVFIAIMIAVIIGLFFLFRSLLLWYWQLDKIEEHLKIIKNILYEIRDNTSGSKNDKKSS